MDDADEILFSSLKSIEVDIPKSGSLKSIDAAFFVAATARCVNIINAEGAPEGEKKLKEKLPKGLAARHRLCTALGSAIKAMGFSGDTSFNNFLYPNEKDARKLLLFLVERLPKEDEEEEENIDGADVVLNRSIRKALRQWNKGPVYQLDDEYFNARTQKRASGNRGNYHNLHTDPLRRVSATDPDDVKSDFAKTFLHLVSHQPPAVIDMPASVLEACCCDAAISAEREAILEEASLSGIDMKKRARLLKKQRQGLLHTAFGQFRGKGDGDADGTDWDLSFNDLVAGYRDDNADLNGLGGSSGVASMFAAAKQFAADNDDPVPAAGDSNGGDGGAGTEGSDGDSKAATKTLDDEAQQEAWDKELEELMAQLDQMEVDRLEANRLGEEMKLSIKMMSTGLLDERQKTDALERAYNLKKQTLSLLPDAAKNVKKLQDIYTTTAKKLMQIGAEWEEHRKPLVSEIRALKASIGERKLACKSKVEQMKRMRAEMKKMAMELREKEKRLKLLLDDWNKRPKTIDRSQCVACLLCPPCCGSRRTGDLVHLYLLCAGTPRVSWSPFARCTSRRRPSKTSCATSETCPRTLT